MFYESFRILQVETDRRGRNAAMRNDKIGGHLSQVPR